MKQVMLVTGATDGIGKATALELGRRGAHVLVHGRSPAKAAQAQAELSRLAPDAAFEALAADLASLEQVRALAKQVRQRFARLDVLVNNAGVAMQERQLSMDGYEMTFAVNHLAHFLLTVELLPLLRASQARVVTVASQVHARGQMLFDDLNASQHFDGYHAYANSKLANVLFSNTLAAREKGALTSNSLHPGVIATKLLRVNFSMGGAGAAEGARTSVYLATSPEVASASGKYYSDSRELLPAPQALELEAQRRLWEMSEKMTGLA